MAVLLLPLPQYSVPQSWQLQLCCDTPNCYEHPEVWNLGESAAGLLDSLQILCFLLSLGQSVIFEEGCECWDCWTCIVSSLASTSCPLSLSPGSL